jgi:uncharacterized protein DUF5399
MPAVTIDKFDIGIYIQYARRTQLIEQVMSQYHMRDATGVPAQALIVNLYPKLRELDILLGIATLSSQWAYFYAPRSYAAQRRSPFSFHRIIPFMGERDKGEEEQKRDEDIIEEMECRTPEDERERKVLKACFRQIEEINSLLRYIGGRIGQFLQG